MIGFDFGCGIATVLGIVVALTTFPLVWAFMSWRSKKEAQQDPDTLMFTSERPLEIKKVPGALGSYLTFLKWTSGNLVGNVLVILGIVGTAWYVMTVAFPANSAGVEFFVDEEPDQAIVLVSARGNLSASQVRDVVAEVDNRILTIAGIRNSVSTATAPGGSTGSGSPIGGVQDKPADVVGELQIELNNFCCRRVATEIFAEIREKTASIPGVKVEVRKIEGGPPTGKDVRLQVKSTDYDAMVAAVGTARAFVDTVPGLVDIEDGRPLPGIEWELAVDREQAGRYGANIVSIGSMVQLVTEGVPIGKYRPDDSEDELDIRVRLPAEERSFSTLDKLKLPTTSGQVPLANFVTRSPQQKVSSITRKDGIYTMEVKANIADGFEENGRGVTPDDKVAEVQAWLDEQAWPESVQFEFRGADEEQKESGEFLAKAAVASLFLMFIILLTMYNSFWQTIITLATVIFAVVGVLLGLMATGQKFSIIMTGTGVIALAGIVVNNAIVLIDTFNRLREEGVETREAVLKTSAQRLRPIMLTTITTILGLIPMALQINMNFFERTIAYGGITSVWWVQLSTASIAGLAFSTILTLVMIPSMLALPANIMAAIRWVFRKFGSRRGRKLVEAVMREDSPTLAGLNAMMRDARVAAPAAALVAASAPAKRAAFSEVVRDGEDASIVPMPVAANESDNRKRDVPDAAE